MARQRQHRMKSLLKISTRPAVESNISPLELKLNTLSNILQLQCKTKTAYNANSKSTNLYFNNPEIPAGTLNKHQEITETNRL